MPEGACIYVVECFHELSLGSKNVDRRLGCLGDLAQLQRPHTTKPGSSGGKQAKGLEINGPMMDRVSA